MPFATLAGRAEDVPSNVEVTIVSCALKEIDMRSLVRSIGIAGGILVFAIVQNASAQVGERVEFTTSFPFTAGYATLPAGTYTIAPDDDSPAMLRLTGVNTSVFVETQNAAPRQIPSKTEVVFKRYGDGYVLKEIWIEGSNEGAETLSVEGERHVAKNDSNGEQHVAARKGSDTSKSR
jgi:hypothetical protein